MVTDTDWIASALEDAKREQPRRWKPEEGDYLGGVVVARGEYMGRHGETKTIDIRVDRGIVGGAEADEGSVYRVTCSPRALRDWIEKENPQEHDLVVVAFEGTDGPHPNSRKRYLAKVAR